MGLGFEVQLSRLKGIGYQNFLVVSVAEKLIKKVGGHSRHVVDPSLSGKFTVIPYQHKISHNIKKWGVGLGCVSFSRLLTN